jgi:hypothetical protein
MMQNPGGNKGRHALTLKLQNNISNGYNTINNLRDINVSTQKIITATPQ